MAESKCWPSWSADEKKLLKLHDITLIYKTVSLKNNFDE